MTIKCEVKFLLSVVFDGDLAGFVPSDNVYYVRLSQHFSHYNGFNGAKAPLPPLKAYLITIVKDQKSVLSTSTTFIHIINLHLNRKKSEKGQKSPKFIFG
jgi:hypothetical protein